jgi:hypothetical protein
MADEFPRAEVIGIDLAPIQPRYCYICYSSLNRSNPLSVHSRICADHVGFLTYSFPPMLMQNGSVQLHVRVCPSFSFSLPSVHHYRYLSQVIHSMTNLPISPTGLSSATLIGCPYLTQTNTSILFTLVQCTVAYVSSIPIYSVPNPFSSSCLRHSMPGILDWSGLIAHSDLCSPPFLSILSN